MDLRLEGKGAAVMAASEGLGRGAAEALSREGARVAICARRADVVERAASEIEAATGNEVIGLRADVAKADDVSAFVDAAAEAWGGLDVLITNKGGPPHGHFADVTDAQWTSAFDLVVLSYVRAVRAALPHLIDGGGAVVAIESTSVKQQIPNLVLSNALRPSVVALSKALARDHAADGVRFNVVLPGSMDTARIRDLTRDQADRAGTTLDEAMRRRLGSIPLGRLGTPRELGELIALLASPAASYITGAVVQADGGIVESIY